MRDKMQCPLCGSVHLKKSNEFHNEQYFLFHLEEKFICENCGCFFLDNKGEKTKLNATKISKKKFFKIIFEAIININGKEFLTKEKKKQLIELYKNNLQSYYQEVADMQANMLYETDCNNKEQFLFQELSKHRI